MNPIQEVNNIVPDCYLVGGACRDISLGIEPKDYDFCCEHSPEKIAEFAQNAGRKVYTIGQRFGTIGFKVEKDGIFRYVEVTTFRSEQYIEGSRKPEVKFVPSLNEDLSRRDFTMNAMAYDVNGNLYDLFNGQEDIKNKIIRTVGNPTIRFKEDPLRMLRAARFASQFGFDIDPVILKSVLKLNHKILTVSRERWCQELDKLLMGDYVSEGLQFLMDTRLWNFMIPELAIQNHYDQKSPWHKLDLWEHTKKVVRNTPKNLNLRWTALLHDIGKPFVQTQKPTGQCNYIKHDLVGAEIVKKTAYYLKWSNEQTKIVVDNVFNHLNDDSILKEYDLEGKE